MSIWGSKGAQAEPGMGPALASILARLDARDEPPPPSLEATASAFLEARERLATAIEADRRAREALEAAARSLSLADVRVQTLARSGSAADVDLLGAAKMSKAGASTVRMKASEGLRAASRELAEARDAHSAAEVRLARLMHESNWPVLRAGGLIVLDRTTVSPPPPSGPTAPIRVPLDWRYREGAATLPPRALPPDYRVAVVPVGGLPGLAG